METIEEWIRALQTTQKAIVVEGSKDKKALEALGIQNIAVLSEKPLFAVAEAIAKQYKEAIILTDFDPKGRELYGKLLKQFQRVGVKVDKTFREFLQKETPISHIEGLSTYFSNSEQ